jgi:hypothetical protein
MGWGSFECGLVDEQPHIGGAFTREFGDEGCWLTGDKVFGVDETCHGGEVCADEVEDIADVVTEDLLVVLALEEVISVWVKGVLAVAACDVSTV